MQTHSSRLSTKQPQKRQSTKKESSFTVESLEVQKRYSRLLSELRVLLNRLHSNKLVFNYGSKVITAKPVDIVRVLSEWSRNDSIDLAIRNIIINTILSSENKQAGSGVLCAYHLINRTQQIDIQKRSTLKNRAEISHIEKTLSYHLGHGIIFNLMREVIHRGGLTSELRFSYSNSNDIIVSIDATREILGHVPPLFETKISKLDNPIVIGVDGTIESLGEIDHLLQACSQLDTPVIIMASGFAPDVITTLDSNWKSRRLRVVPFSVVSWSKENIEKVQENRKSALEICEKLGIVCMSSDTGDSLVNKTIDDFKRIETAYFNNMSLMIPEALGDNLYSDIRLPKKFKDISGVIRDRCKIAQKVCIGLARSGRLTDKTFDSFQNHFGNSPFTSYTAESIAIRSAVACDALVKNIGAMVIT